MDITNYIAQQQQRISQVLDALLPQEENNTLFAAMRYTMLSGGKRFRPLLAYATGESLKSSTNNEMLDLAAAAVELIHNYSLIHDDLPSMDDDDMRHGKPSCHKAFGEAIAILTGDALISLAFEILSDSSKQSDATAQLHLVHELARASGAKGMVLGQALDMLPEEVTSIDALETMHIHKTGALIQASILMGAYAAGCTDKTILDNLKVFSHYLGLAYQIQDDILDLEASSEHLGKPAKSDIKNDKQTYPVLAGIKNAKEQALGLYQRALATLEHLKLEKSILAELVKHFMNRSK